ncbi:MAG: hypothetical protein ACRD6B_05935 [Bryobacteraceae bacterium]
MIVELDHAIGRMLDVLKETGQEILIRCRNVVGKSRSPADSSPGLTRRLNLVGWPRDRSKLFNFSF